MSSLGWLQQASQDVPPDDDWLAPSERAVLERLATPKRRADWRLGRWTAKRALLLGGARLFRSLRLPPVNGSREGWPRLSVTGAADGAPEAFLDGCRLPLRLSITHRAGIAGCLVAPDGVLAGCDVELAEPRDPSFVEDYFTAAERAIVLATPPEGRPLTTALIWSAKESALKALRVGLRADTREVDVRLLPWLVRSGWLAFAVHHAERPRLLSGWWRTDGRHVLTLVAWPPHDPPTLL